MNILENLAEKLNMDKSRIAGILLELPEITATQDEQEQVFDTARQEGLDFNKLQIGRRIHTRKEALDEVINYIESHPTWKREEVISYIRYSSSLMRRVQKKILPEFFK